MENLTPSELIRYSRQMMIRGWGEKTQKKIKGARVAIAGIGGLGSPVSLYLAAAGVGYLRLINSDGVPGWLSGLGDGLQTRYTGVRIPTLAPWWFYPDDNL